MIVVDSSAIVAIFQNEPEALVFSEAIAAADQLIMLAVNAHETATVLHVRRGSGIAEDFWCFLKVKDIAIASCDETQFCADADAYRRFGKCL